MFKNEIRLIELRLERKRATRERAINKISRQDVAIDDLEERLAIAKQKQARERDNE